MNRSELERFAVSFKLIGLIVQKGLRSANVVGNLGARQPDELIPDRLRYRQPAGGLYLPANASAFARRGERFFATKEHGASPPEPRGPRLGSGRVCRVGCSGLADHEAHPGRARLKWPQTRHTASDRGREATAGEAVLAALVEAVGRSYEVVGGTLITIRTGPRRHHPVSPRLRSPASPTRRCVEAGFKGCNPLHCGSSSPCLTTT